MKILAVLALAAGLLVGVPQAAHAQDSCNGRPATLVGGPGQSLAGTDGRDVVVTNGAASIDTFDGVDVVCVTGGVPEYLNGGGDRDRVVVAAPDGRIEVDLGAGTLKETPGGSGELLGFEDVTVRAHSALVDGTTGVNDIRWNVCLATITAQLGSDTVRWAGGSNLCVAGDDRTVGIFGGGGKDVLVGSPWVDDLIGGRAFDRGDGKAGRDRCRVEAARNCEWGR